MRANESELSYNQTWAFLQFKVYDMSFGQMRRIIADIQNMSCSNLPFIDVNTEKCYFKEGTGSRHKGLALLQVELSAEQYRRLQETNPDDEIKNI